jgi:hypothetical protein
VAVDRLAVDFADMLGEELGDVLVGRPVDRHAEVVAVDVLELLLEVLALEPVVAEPVEVGELLVGQLIELAVRTGGEGLADEVVDVQARQRHVLALAGHPVGQVDHVAVAEVRADQVGVVDVGVKDVLARLHLSLQLLDHVAFLDQVVGDLDAGDLLEGLGQDLGFVLVGRNGLGDDLDRHALEGLGRLDEPLHLLHLLVLGERRRLKFVVHPLLGRGHVGSRWKRRAGHGQGQKRGGRKQAQPFLATSIA